jgi:hypothetical protein
MPDTFLDNPFVQSIGNAMGLAPLMGSSNADAGFGGSGDGQMPPPAPPPKPAVAPMKVMKPGSQGTTPREFRQHAPEAKSSRGLGLGGGQPPMGMNLPGVMSPEVLMHPAVQELLGKYGITSDQLQNTADNASPNLFMTSPGFNQRHPMLSRGIEGALEGAAFTRGSQTWGEGISNVAQGLLAGHQAQADKYNNQLMMPFAQANQVAQLQNVANEQKFREAQANRDEALSAHYGNMDNTAAELAQIKQQLADTQAERVKDLQAVHKRESNWHMQTLLQRTPLNDDESQKLQKLIPEGGSIDDVEPADLSDLIAQAGSRKLKEDRANKLGVAAIGAAPRSAATAADTDYKDRSLELKGAQDEFTTAQKSLENFRRGLSTNMMADYNGRTVAAGSQPAKDAEAALVKAMSDAQAKIDTATVRRTQPGAGMTIPKSGTKTQPKKQWTPSGIIDK